MRCGRPGLVRLAAAGRAPRLRRAGGGGVVASVSLCAVAPHWWAAALPRPLSLSSTCACSSPCLLRVRCHGARAVQPRAGRVVHLCSVRSDRATSARHHRRHLGGAPARALCWRCACLRCRACVPHAPVACTCCTCACCACLRYARLRFPCSRCVHLLCVPLLCVPALCAFVWCVVCLCSARLHRADFFRQRRRHPFQSPSAPSDAPARRPLMLMHMHLPYPLTHSPCCRFNPLKTIPGHVVFGLDYSGLASSL